MRKSILVLAGAIVIAAGGVSYAISGNTTITACVEPANNQMFLAPTGSCPVGQQTLSWNQQGPQGEPGVQGAMGATGATGQTGAPGPAGSVAPASDAVVGIVTARYRRSFATSLVVDGVGTHLVTGHVHIHVDPSKWKRDGRITCELGDDPDGLLDSSITPVTHGGSVTDFNVDLNGLVKIDPPPSSQSSQSIAPTAETVGFHCGTLMLGTSTKFAPIFTFVRMSDEPFTPPVVKLPIKVAVKKFGP